MSSWQFLLVSYQCGLTARLHVAHEPGHPFDGGGVVVVERVFNWPGMGSLAFDAVSSRDYPVLQSVIMVLSTLIVLVNLAVDIAYGLVDPRIRTE